MGYIVATTSSQGRIGVTINCAIVPRSRSRTIAVAVKMEVKAYRIIPITPGIMKKALTRSGLYQTWVRTSIGSFNAVVWPQRARRSAITLVANDWPINCAAERDGETTVGS